MAAVSVFVDDAVRGNLPLVCAKTGEPADLIIRMQHPVGGGLGAAWLLVFLGPPGWLVLLLLALVSPGTEYLTVRVPQTEAAYYRERALERARLATLVLGFAGCVAAIVMLGALPRVWLALGVASLVAAVAFHTVVQSQAIRVRLDASRRWVTLSGVHPEFVRAVQAREPVATGAGR